MKKSLTTVDFHGTKEQEEKLVAIIRDYKDTKGSMMLILQQAQEIYGYLPIEVQKIVARETGASLEEIYGITTFYSQFKLNPNGKYAISVCLGTACYVKGSQALLDEIAKELGVEAGSTSKDGKYSVEATRCIGACGLAPVLCVNGDVYGRLTPQDIPGILAKYKD
ncbi:MAG: NAD(P)H-dependent oxidoreductase subunit E [Clostridia bacterium]|nr:NAD(P)H-dependent oxidoreductase subunit E [Clostridia bacterium]